MDTHELRLADILIDDALLLRPLSESTAKEYAEGMVRRNAIPPIDVFFDGNVTIRWW